jgi:putative heme degradation protein
LVFVLCRPTIETGGACWRSRGATPWRHHPRLNHEEPSTMTTAFRRSLSRRAGAAAMLAALSAGAYAADVNKGIEQALAAAQESKKGIMVYVGGQAIGGGVVKIEAGQWVELRSQQYGRIVIRMDRIDGIAMP